MTQDLGEMLWFSYCIFRMKGFLWKGLLFGLAHAENGEHDDDTLDEIKRFKIESCNAADKELPENSSIL